MKTMKMQFVEAVSAPDAPLPLRVAKLTWQHLPVILCADLWCCMALVPAALTWLLGWPLLSPWLAALTLGPAWAATCAVADSLVRGEEASWRDLLVSSKRYWRSAAGISLLPALSAMLLLGTWSILAAHPGMTWLYLPLCVDGCVATLFLLAGLSAFPLHVTRGLRGLRLWKTALALTTLRAGRMVGTLALFLFLALALLLLNAGLLPLLCAPLAMCLAAFTRQACEVLLSKPENGKMIGTTHASV